PFTEITENIVQAPCIGLQFSRFVIFSAAVVLKIAVFLQLLRAVTKRILGWVAGTTGVFPFSLSGQAIEYPRLIIEPFAVRHRRLLAHAVGGMFGASAHAPGEVNVLGGGA